MKKIFSIHTWLVVWGLSMLPVSSVSAEENGAQLTLSDVMSGQDIYHLVKDMCQDFSIYDSHVSSFVRSLFRAGETDGALRLLSKYAKREVTKGSVENWLIQKFEGNYPKHSKQFAKELMGEDQSSTTTSIEQLFWKNVFGQSAGMAFSSAIAGVTGDPNYPIKLFQKFNEGQTEKGLALFSEKFSLTELSKKVDAQKYLEINLAVQFEHWLGVFEGYRGGQDFSRNIRAIGFYPPYLTGGEVVKCIPGVFESNKEVAEFFTKQFLGFQAARNISSKEPEQPVHITDRIKRFLGR